LAGVRGAGQTGRLGALLECEASPPEPSQLPMTAPYFLALIALLSTAVGTLLMAWDVFFSFKGNTHGGLTFDNDDGEVRKTPAYNQWEARSARRIIVDLGLLLFAIVLQFVAMNVPA